MATFRFSGSNTCPASAHPMRRPHAIIFRPFRSSPNSSTMHFIRASQPLTLPRYALSSRHRTAGRFTASHAHLDFVFPVGISAPSTHPEIISHLASSSSLCGIVISFSHVFYCVNLLYQWGLTLLLLRHRHFLYSTNGAIPLDSYSRYRLHYPSS